MIFVGIDDTDILGSKGTNQLARAIVQAAQEHWRCRWIVRHQLLDDPRIPYTSQNGAASIALEPRESPDIENLIETCRRVMRQWYIEGSDPGLCVTDVVPAEISDFGKRCGCEVVTQAEARELAAKHDIRLEGLGGTDGGVIGALAAVGLAALGDDGRIVQWREWPDDLTGEQSVSVLHDRNIILHDIHETGDVQQGVVHLGKRLRPNLRGGKAVLFVQKNPTTQDTDNYQALKLP